MDKENLTIEEKINKLKRWLVSFLVKQWRSKAVEMENNEVVWNGMALR